MGNNSSSDPPNEPPGYVNDFQKVKTMDQLMSLLTKQSVKDVWRKSMDLLQDDNRTKKKKQRKKLNKKEFQEMKPFLQSLLDLVSRIDKIYSDSKDNLQCHHDKVIKEKDNTISSLKGISNNVARKNQRLEQENQDFKIQLSHMERLQKASQQTHYTQVTHLKQKLAEVDHERQRYECQMWETRKANESLKDEIKQLHANMNQINTEYKSWKEQALRLRSELEETKASLKWIQAQNKTDKPTYQRRSEHTISVYDNQMPKLKVNAGYTMQSSTPSGNRVPEETMDGVSPQSNQKQRSNMHQTKTSAYGSQDGEDRVRNLEHQLKQKDRIISEWCSVIAEKEHTIKRLEDDYKIVTDRLEVKVAELTQQLNEKKKKVKHLTNEKNKCYASNDRLHNECMVKDNQIKQLQTDVQTVEQRSYTANVHRGVQQSQEMLQRNENELHKVQWEVDRKNKQIQELHQQVVEYRKANSQLQNQITEQERVIEQLKEDVRTAENKSNSQNLQMEVHRSKDMLQRKEKELQGVKWELEGKNKQIQDLSDQLNQQVVEERKVKSQLQSHITEQERVIQQLQEDVRTAEHKSNSQNIQMEVHRSKDMLQRKENELQRVNWELSNQVQDLSNKLHQQVGDESQLQNQLTEKERMIQQLQKDLLTAEHKSNSRKLQMEIQGSKDMLQRKESELQGVKWELDVKNKQLKDLSDQAGDVRQVKSQLQNQITEQKRIIQQLQEDVRTATNKPRGSDSHKKLEDMLQRKEKELQDTKSELETKNTQIKELSRKLAAEMSTKLAADESNVENVSIKNRPMNVAEEYQLLCSNQWLEAKNILDDLGGSNTPDFVKLQLLSNVIMVSEQASNTMLQNIMDHFERMLFDPIECVFPGGKALSTTSKRKGNLSKELNNMYGDMLRTAADNIDIQKLVRNILKTLEKSSTSSAIWKAAIRDEDVHKYVEDSARICWKMVIQRPKMEFKRCDRWLGEKCQELYWNSDNSPNPVVIQVYPMLYHSQSLMAKGKVLLIDQRKLAMF